MYRFLCGRAFGFSWVELLDHTVTLHVTFWGTTRLISKTIVPFHIPSSSVSSQFLLSGNSTNQPALPLLVPYRPSLERLFSRQATFQYTFKKGTWLGSRRQPAPAASEGARVSAPVWVSPATSPPHSLPRSSQARAPPAETTVTAPSTMSPQVTQKFFRGQEGVSEGSHWELIRSSVGTGFICFFFLILACTLGHCSSAEGVLFESRPISSLPALK